MAIIAIAVGWYIDNSSETDVYYFHVYTPTYGPNQDLDHPEYDPENPAWGNTRVGTFTVNPGVPFYFNSPIDRNPALIVEGLVNRRKDGFDCDFTIWFDDNKTTFEHKQTEPIAADELSRIFVEYYFSISTEKDPYSLDYEI